MFMLYYTFNFILSFFTIGAMYAAITLFLVNALSVAGE